MKRLLLFCGSAGLLLGSAAPPTIAAVEPLPDRAESRCVACESPTTQAIGVPPVATPILPAPAPAPSTAAPNPPLAVSKPSLATPAAATPEAKPVDRGVRIVVSIPQQKAYVFDDRELVATSPVSTGKRGYETPTGTFPILQKKMHHRSNKYANAPMPYMQRLTWGGVALHAGHVPGRPASHGCIRLPRQFAKKLYRLTDFGTRVTVTRKRLKSSKDALALT